MFELNLSPVIFTPSDPKRAGQKKKNFSGRFSYTSFLPVNLQDVQLTYTADLVKLVGAARAALAELSTRYAMLSPAQQRSFQAEMIDTEAAASLKLTQAEERPLADNPDFYWLKRAIPYAVAALTKLPLSRRLLLEIHDMAMHDQSHYKQNPGEFRRSPVWLGPEKATLSKGASFVPPAPEDMDEAFSQLEHYIHEETATEPLVKSALIHYQLEMIHPFLDGNGRVGRLVNLLYLQEAGLLPAPILPLSTQLLNQSFYYYAHLLGVEKRGAYEIWVNYWLKATLQAAQVALDALDAFAPRV